MAGQIDIDSSGVIQTTLALYGAELSEKAEHIDDLFVRMKRPAKRVTAAG